MELFRNIISTIVNSGNGFIRIKEKEAIFPSLILFVAVESFFSIVIPLIIFKEWYLSVHDLWYFILIGASFYLFPYIVHLTAIRYSSAGRYKGLLALFGYTYVPYLLVIPLIPLILSRYFPGTLLALGVAVYFGAGIWSAILIIQAVRMVYMGTLKKTFLTLFIAFIITSVFVSVFVSVGQTFFARDYFAPLKINPAVMSPTIDETIIDGIPLFSLDKIIYWFKKPAKGDLVVFVRETAARKINMVFALSVFNNVFPEKIWVIGNKEEYLGRIIAEEGEKARVEKGQLKVNGQPIEEEYVRYKKDDLSMPEITIPAGYFLVLPDNRNYSLQSPYGLVKKACLKGKVYRIAKPFIFKHVKGR